MCDLSSEAPVASACLLCSAAVHEYFILAWL